MLLRLWRFHQTGRIILVELFIRCTQPWYAHGISICKVSHMIGHQPIFTAAYGVIFPIAATSVNASREFTVTVIALGLPTTYHQRYTTKATPVSGKLRTTTTPRGLTMTNMLRANLDVAHHHRIPANPRLAGAPTVSGFPHARKTGKRKTRYCPREYHSNLKVPSHLLLF